MQKLRKPTRTISGVAPIAVMSKPKKCEHGTCIYCPSFDAPQSYTTKSPAVLRAIAVNYDPYKQTRARLEAFQAMGHPTDKIELIVMGGTFLSQPIKYQYRFIKKCYDALNRKRSKTLEKAKKLNEKAKHRCVALCIETRPDVCGKKEINRLLKFGCTRVELGVQILDNNIYRFINRSHTVREVINATKLLKDSGFKIGYHIMPNLPKSNPKKDIKLFKKIFSDEKFRPDQLKIYPTQVIKNSGLENLYLKKKHNPYSEKELIKVLIKFKTHVPPYCRIMRIMREIPPEYLVAGIRRMDLRNIVNKEMERKHLKCKCIRCREIGFALQKNVELKSSLSVRKTKYNASGGKEIFFSIENQQNIIFGLCRLRLPYKPFRKELTTSAIIRELHIYGSAVNLENKPTDLQYQHRGLGRQLLKAAENFALKHSYERLAVISGVGVRNYYKHLGYKLEGAYMCKNLMKG